MMPYLKKYQKFSFSPPPPSFVHVYVCPQEFFYSQYSDIWTIWQLSTGVFEYTASSNLF